MSVDVEGIIYDAMCEHLQTFDFLSELSEFYTDIPEGGLIAYPGVPYEPPQGPYLEVSWIPNDTFQVELGTTAKNRHQGIFQVMVYWPKDETGINPPRKIAGKIKDLFKRGVRLIEPDLVVRMRKPPHIAQTFDSGAHSLTPVTIYYLADAPN